MSSSLTYVYCLVRASGQPSLRRVPPPVPGGRPVRLLEVPSSKSTSRGPRSRGRDWLVVSSVPARHYNEAALDRGLQHLDWVGARALAHEAVVEHFLSEPAVLPMRLFALFTSDERAIQHVAHDRHRIARILARIGGCAEWGLRLTWSPPRERDSSVRGSDSGLTPPSGTAYLARKRNLREAGRPELARARRDANRLYRAIRRTAVASKRRTDIEQAAPGSPVVLEAAFLVRAGRGPTFEASVRRHTRPLQRAGMAVSLTGPWPAYNFI